jgi:hypothetical protein
MVLELTNFEGLLLENLEKLERERERDEKSAETNDKKKMNKFPFLN